MWLFRQVVYNYCEYKSCYNQYETSVSLVTVHTTVYNVHNKTKQLKNLNIAPVQKKCTDYWLIRNRLYQPHFCSISIGNSCRLIGQLIYRPWWHCFRKLRPKWCFKMTILANKLVNIKLSILAMMWILISVNRIIGKSHISASLQYSMHMLVSISQKCPEPGGNGVWIIEST